jgi:uncharacterized protein
MSGTARVWVALATFVGWVIITVFGPRLFAPAETRSLYESVSQGLSWNLLAAGLFLVAVAVLMGWRDLGLRGAPLGQSLRLAWLPLVIVAFLIALGILLGLPPAAVIVFVGLNVLLVGFSEELMFRGVLLSAFAGAMRIWPAMLLSALMFGAVHSLNVFVTGDLMAALTQSTMAFMSGFTFLALRVRTGSLVPPMLLHAAWDFGTFVLGGSRHSAAPVEAEPATLVQLLIPLGLVLPCFLYALYLLRKVGREDKLC